MSEFKDKLFGNATNGSCQTSEEEAARNRLASAAKRQGVILNESQIKLLTEKDPNGIDLKTAGAKADLGKDPILRGMVQYFPRAILSISRVSATGAKKYSWKGWESVPDGITRYGDALVRHLIAEELDGPYDADTGLLHAAQVAWNALARLELILGKKERELLDASRGVGTVCSNRD